MRKYQQLKAKFGLQPVCGCDRRYHTMKTILKRLASRLTGRRVPLSVHTVHKETK